MVLCKHNRYPPDRLVPFTVRPKGIASMIPCATDGKLYIRIYDTYILYYIIMYNINSRGSVYGEFNDIRLGPLII